MSASIVPYKGFRTLDGDILLGGGNDRLFGILCDKLERPEWKLDAKFATNGARVENREELEALIEAETRKRTTAAWLDILDESGMPYAAINDVQTTLGHEHGKHSSLPSLRLSVLSWSSTNAIAIVLARDMVSEVNHTACGPMKLVNTPVKFSHSEPQIRMAPPLLGQHTDEILSHILDMTPADIDNLKKEGVVA